MLRYALRRLLELVPTTAGVLLLTFLLFHVVGGSPAEVALGQHATAAALEAFDARHGYDKPLLAGRWAPCRAWSDGAPLPADGRLAPAFPLAPGRWRLILRGVDSPVAATIRLARADVAATNSLDALFRPSACGRGWIAEWTVPAGWTATRIDATGGGAPAAARARLARRTAHLLDSQLVNYLGSLLRGDLGDSTAYGMRVARVLREGAGPSLALTLPMLAGGTLLALLLAMAAAVWRERTPDRAVLLGTTLLMSVNYVVWVLAGQYLLAYRLRLFPLWGFEHWIYLLLPVLIGLVSGLGRDTRFYRTVLLDELHRPYVRTAIAKGLRPARILWRHVLRNSLIPVVTVIALGLPAVFGGAIITEQVFKVNGLGQQLILAIHANDLPMVMTLTFIFAILIVSFNLIADLLYGILDPRIRYD